MLRTLTFISFLFITYPVICQQLVIERFDKIAFQSTINQIHIDSDNTIWFCSDNGLYQLKNINEDPIALFSNMNILSIEHDPRLGHFITDGKDLFNVETKENFKIEENLQIRDIEIYKGRIYLATNNGVHIINPTTKTTEVWNTKNTKLKSDEVNFILEDKKGILWLGTQKGEIRIDGDKWKNYHETTDVNNYYENKEGVWFIGNGEMWLVDYYNREYNAGLNSELFSGRLNDFAIDSKGRLYVASDKLVRYDPYEETTTEYSEDAGLLSKKCTSIASDLNDNIWIGTEGAGIYRLVFGDVANNQLIATCLLEKEVSCTDGSDAIIKVAVSGGKGPYNFQWSNDLIKGVNPKNLSAGKYTVTVTDQIQNKHTAEITINSPKPISLELQSLNRISAAGKKDGSIEVLANGGTGLLNYSWSNGKKENKIEKLAAGTYNVTVTDSQKCSAVSTYEVPKEKYIPELNIQQISVGKTLRINELYFLADSTFVIPESYEVLDEVYDFLVANPSVMVEIGGHTNTIPPDQYCDELSSNRAKNVALYFYNKGIPTDRLSYKGYGKRQPITLDESLQGRQKNQRVEIKILAL